MNQWKYEEEFNIALNAVEKVYEQIISNTSLSINLKSDNTLVTNIDVATDEYLMSHIKGYFQHDNFLTEEKDSENAIHDRTWIIDPIDGTEHFIKDSIFWGIQLAFSVDNEIQFSIIYLPKINELYYAKKGFGVYLNEKKITRNQNITLEQSLIEFGGSLNKYWNEKKVYLDKLIRTTQGTSKILHINCSCFSFANLISGRTDVLIESTRKIWDIAPGQFMCEELEIPNYQLNDGMLNVFSLSKDVDNILLNM
ncbi:MAG: inositol monophosphatase family protein [Oscillospiraceae bacterium]|nr:inositol monophosphatase family protein [Oscillospiraceae bacterium]